MDTVIGHTAFDEQLQRTLTAATRGCGDLGEALAVADRIPAGDLDSWARQWTSLADAVLADADASLSVGDPVSARRGYLRASEYYRQGFFFHRSTLDDPFLHQAYPAHVAAFEAAVPLLTCAATPLDVAHNGVTVRGYLFRPDASGRPRPTILAPAGYDSTAESGFSFTAVTALEHDMNCLVFEGPGQGGVLYQLRQTLRADAEVVLPPVVDWLLTQPGVDPARLVLFGRSFAGYLAARMASGEHRLAALICDPAQYDFGAAIRHQLGESNWTRLLNHDPTLDGDLASLLDDPLARSGYQWRMTAHGVSTMSDYLRELATFTLDGRAHLISCPTLALAGEGDFAGTGQLQILADALTVPVVTHTFTTAEGAGGHCEGLGQDRLDQTVYGWLTNTLTSTAATTFA